MSKFRNLKSYENNNINWNGKSHKFFSAMKNTDITYANAFGWNEMIKDANNSLQWAKYNRENNSPYVAMYNKNNSIYGRKRKNLTKV
jgi:hypothetical protein